MNNITPANDKKPSVFDLIIKKLALVPKKLVAFIKESPLAFKIIACTAILCAIIHLLCSFIPSFADFIVRYPNALIRWVLAKITNIIPFSLAEMVIILLPVILIILFAICFYISFKGSEKAYTRYLSTLLSILMTIYSLFVLTLAPGYKGHTLSTKLELEQKDVSAEELYNTSLWLVDKINENIDGVSYGVDGSSVMPYSLDEMNEKLNDAYSALADEYSFIPHLRSKLKYVILSEPMTYTHISGVYTFYTGEANVNVNFPDYTIPFTAAHEMAHQRGTAPENEANFVAFLACMKTDDPYILYSGYVNMLEYCMNALYSADPQLYYDLYEKIDSKLQHEFNAYAAFYDKYRDNVAADVSGAINNNYLQSQGQSAGSRSYGLVVDLTVAYYHEYIEKNH